AGKCVNWFTTPVYFRAGPAAAADRLWAISCFASVRIRRPLAKPRFPVESWDFARGEQNDAVDDGCAGSVDGRDIVPVRPVRHGRGADPDRRAFDPDAAADGDGAARDYADGLEWLARLPVATPYPMAAGCGLPDRMSAGAGRLVDHPLRAG